MALPKVVKYQKIVGVGHSAAVVIDADYMRKNNLKIGDTVQVHQLGGEIKIVASTPTTKPKKGGK